MTRQPIATVTSVTGTAFARNEKGELRPLQPGDSLLKGDVVVTTMGGHVEISFADDSSLQIVEDQTLKVTPDLLEGDLADAADNALAKDTVAKVLQLLEEGKDIDSAIEAPAAGLAGGKDDGHGFVRLVRITETLSQETINIPGTSGTEAPTFENVIEAVEEPIETAVNADPVADDDELTTSEDTAIRFDADVLANDTDLDGDTLSIDSFTQPTNGTISTDTDGNLVYTPNPNYNGPDSFTYTVKDGNGGSDTATVTVNVTPENDAPDAVDDAFSTQEETPLILVANDLLGNDTDPDGDTLSIDSVQDAIGGSVTLVDGEVIFTPAPEYNGPASFTYTISDGAGGTDTATVNLTIEAVNDAPDAIDDAASGSEGATITVLAGGETSVLANDTDAEGNPLTVTGFSQPSNGTVTVNADGTFSYTHDGGETTSDSFTYTISDGAGGTDTATVNLTIEAVNDAPDAIDDAASGSEGATITVLAGGETSVLANDTDAEGNPLTVTGFSQPSNGTVTVNADGTFSYTHDGGETTSDSFTYTISDGAGGTDTATVNLTIEAVNDAPDAIDDAASGSEGATITVLAGGETSVLANDTDAEGNPLTVTGFSQPSNGTVTVNADGTFSYTHDGGETTSDSFTYTISDGAGGTDTATVNLTIEAVNDAPDAIDDAASGSEGATITVLAGGETSVLANDTDAEGNPLTVTGFSQPSNGTVTVNADGTFSYTHDGGETTSDSFTYTISDGAGGTDTATVNLTIEAVNDAPDAIDDAASGSEGATITVLAGGETSVLANDTDAEGNPLTVTGFSQPSNGTVTVNADGTFSYTHDGGETTSDSFTYTISDGAGGTDTATVNLTIEAVNDAPDAIDDAASGSEGATITVLAGGETSVLANDTDAEGNPLTVTGFSQPSNGTVTVNADGTFSYTHDGGETTSDSFTYTISDGAGGTDTATVNLTIEAVNDAPDAIDDAASGSEGATITVLAGGETSVLANDTDAEGNPLTVTGFSQPSNGTVTVNADGTFSYTHDGGETTSDSFTYTISDGAGGTDTATVNLTIEAVNDAPDAIDDAASGSEGATITVLAGGETSVLANDTDAEGNPLTVTGFSQPSNGTVTVNADGTFSYTHDGGETTSDSFTYTISDGAGGTDTATVNLTIEAVNDAPDAIDDAASGSEGATITVLAGGETSVLANDTDAEGNPLTVTGFSQPSNGTVTVNADGTFSYTHDGGETTSDSFTYTISDGAGGTDTATVNLTIEAVNDAPDAIDDAASGSEGATITVLAGGETSVLANDTDAEGNPLTVTGFSQPSNGTVTVNADGTFSYTHDGGETTSDSFTYTISDGAGGTDTATVNLTIEAVNDAPEVGTSRAIVSEEGLPNGIADSGTTDATVFNGSIAINDVDGDAMTATLSAPSSLSLASNGAQLIWQGDGTALDPLVAKANGETIITVENTDVTDSAVNYTVTLGGPIDHPAGDGANTSTFDLNVHVDDGSLTTDSTLSITVEDDTPVAYDNANLLVMGETISGEVLGNDLGADAATKVASVTFDGKEYAPDSNGEITITTDNGVLTMHGDGSYDYDSTWDTSIGGADDGTGGFTDAELAMMRFYRGANSGYEEFLIDDSYKPVANNILSVDWGGQASEPKNDPGIGVAGGSGNADYLNGHPDNPEAIMVNLGDEATSLTANFFSLSNSESPVYWAVYDSDGDIVGTGSHSTNIGSFDFSVEVITGNSDPVPFQYIAFYATEDNANLKLSFEGLDNINYSDVDPDTFDYVMQDADGDNSTASLTITQFAPANSFEGDAGDNVLHGDSGDNLLTGGAGDDTLTGDLGADTFAWHLGDEGTSIHPAVDTITDFSTTEGDNLFLSDLLQDEHAGNLENYLHFVEQDGNTVVHVSHDGSFVPSEGNYDATDQVVVLHDMDISSLVADPNSAITDATIIEFLQANKNLTTD